MSLPLFELDDWFATTEGRFDFSLSHSGCQLLSVGDVLDGDELRSFAEVTHTYGVFEGLAELRQAIAEEYETLR